MGGRRSWGISHCSYFDGSSRNDIGMVTESKAVSHYWWSENKLWEASLLSRALYFFPDYTVWLANIFFHYLGLLVKKIKIKKCLLNCYESRRNHLKIMSKMLNIQLANTMIKKLLIKPRLDSMFVCHIFSSSNWTQQPCMPLISANLRLFSDIRKKGNSLLFQILCIIAHKMSIRKNPKCKTSS